MIPLRKLAPILKSLKDIEFVMKGGVVYKNITEK